MHKQVQWIGLTSILPASSHTIRELYSLKCYWPNAHLSYS